MRERRSLPKTLSTAAKIGTKKGLPLFRRQPLTEVAYWMTTLNVVEPVMFELLLSTAETVTA
jgi:hypothetical protein